MVNCVEVSGKRRNSLNCCLENDIILQNYEHVTVDITKKNYHFGYETDKIREESRKYIL